MSTRKKQVSLATPPPYATLVSLHPASYPSLSLRVPRILIGRNKNCTIQMNDKHLSGVHLEVSRADKVIKLIDRSTNGSYINGVKMAKNEGHIVKEGDKVSLLHESKVGKQKVIDFTLEIHLKDDDDIIQDRKKSGESQEEIMKQAVVEPEVKKSEDIV